MPCYADRVKDTTTSTGTGTITLSGTAPSGYRTFATAFGSSSTLVEYCIAGGTEWEVGRGTFNGTTGLTRENVSSSSNSSALVNFSAGSKDVFVTASAEQIEGAGKGSQYAFARGMALP
jgi:hypothetical protein